MPPVLGNDVRVHPQQLLDNRYRLVEELGSGGMSVVWHAHDLVLDRSVAVKVLAGALASDPVSRRRIRAEAQAAARLWHPNITNVYDYGESVDDDGEPAPYVVMELLPGQTLTARLASGPLPPAEALQVCAQVAAALAAAHEQQLVHRDIKPSNVVLTTSGVKVLDFGIVAVAGEPDDSLDGEVLGTPAYLAPERLLGGQVLAASDVYALGLLIHRTLTNQLPWDNETTTQMLRAHVYLAPRPLPVMAQVPVEVNDVCRRCLAKDPHERPTASEVAATLSQAAATLAAPPILPAPAVLPAPAEAGARAEATGRPSSRVATRPPDGRTATTPTVAPADPPAGRRRLAAAAVAVAVLVAAAVGWQLVQPDGDGDVTGLEVGRSPDTPASGPSARPALAGSPAVAPAGATAAAVTSAATSVEPAPATSAAGAPGPAGLELGLPITARGGTVWVGCVRLRTARIVDVDPAAGYAVTEMDAGPAGEVRAVLESATNVSEIRVRCELGLPDPEIRESPR
jgi:eukaryotic-like serine/threonine-protein kinase